MHVHRERLACATNGGGVTSDKWWWHHFTSCHAIPPALCSLSIHIHQLMSPWAVPAFSAQPLEAQGATLACSHSVYTAFCLHIEVSTCHLTIDTL